MRLERNGVVGSAPADLSLLVSLTRRTLLCAAMLLSAVFVWGCAGYASSQSTPVPPPPPPTYSISGTISPVTGGSGATVTLSGAAAATATADGSGNYVFTGLANGMYALTPSNTGYAFSPTSQSATVSGANLKGVNFTATAQQAHSVALSWNASTSTIAGYNVYRSTVSGTAYLKINSSLVAVLSFTDASVVNSTTYYYVTTAVDANGNESAYSNEVSASIP